MRNRMARVCLVAIFVLVVLVPSLNADWSEDGIELCNNTATQRYQEIVSDGAGGAIVVWQDEREGTDTWDVYAQRFDAGGNILWDAGGVNISSLGMSQFSPVLVSDGAGGAIVVYQNDRMGSDDITAQRILANGLVAWPVGGVTVCNAPYYQQMPRVVSDGFGGAIVTWQDNRSNVDWDIYAAKIDSDGNMPWTTNGIPVCTSADDQAMPVITTDGSGGAIIAWPDYRNGNNDIFAQKINFLGSRVWANNGNPVVDNTERQTMPSIIPDMNGGAIIAWTEGSTSAKDILAQRMLSDGTQAWDPGQGITVCEADEIQSTPVMVSDGNGGAIITWQDNRSVSTDIYVQHVDFAGGINWADGGNCVCCDAYAQSSHEIVSDGAGGAIILWTDYRRSSNNDIYGQHISAGGNAKWTFNGKNLSSWPANQQNSRAIAADGGGVIVSWWDERDLNNPDKIYAQKFGRYGYWGDPAPVISSCSDVPSDQGGQVLIEWAPIRMDEFPEDLVTHYTVWRSISAPDAMALSRDGSNEGVSVSSTGLIVDSPCEVGPDFEGTAYRTDIVFGAAAAWEWVASVDAHYWDEYAYTCGTLRDFINDLDNGMHYFVITANTDDPFTFWDSAPDSAYSVDNLAPCVPMGIAGDVSFSPAGLEITWSPNSEVDLGGYKIYRVTDPLDDPSEDALLASTCDTLVLDGEWTSEEGFWYKVAAFDIHGNMSGFALLGPGQVTGEDPMPLPDATFLAQNYPNPFNPNTTIAFGLKSDGFVNLSVYDAAGRQVAVLINESRPAGQYATVWNGKGQNGSPAASGVYFYKLETGEFAKTRKMILLR